MGRLSDLASSAFVSIPLFFIQQGMNPPLLWPIFAWNVGVVVSLNSGIEGITLGKFHYSVQHLNRISVQVQ